MYNKHENIFLDKKISNKIKDVYWAINATHTC